MARTRSLTNLLADVRFQSDVQGFSLRHDDTNLTRLINQSIQDFRDKVSSEGIQHYLTSATGTMTAGVTSGYPFKILDCSAFSPNVVRVFGVDVQLTDTRWQPLRAVDFVERANYQWPGGIAGGNVPEAFANMTTYTLAIMPAPGRTITYRVWYLPLLTDLATGSDTFDGITGFEQWLVWDVCAKVVTRDQNPQGYSLITTERDRAWADVLRGSSKVNAAGGALKRMDTMGRRESTIRNRSWFR